jgi:hypothetical protein
LDLIDWERMLILGNRGGQAAVLAPLVPWYDQPPFETDSQGNYVLRRVPPGRYLVGVEFPLGYAPNPNGFATTFYPGVTDSTKAQAVVIEPESDVQNVNFTLQRAARFTVSGTLQLNRIRVAGVSLHPVGEPNMAPTFFGGVTEDGHFEIQNVLAGSYELSVDRGAIPIHVPVQVLGNVTGITANLPPMSSIEGTLTAVLRPEDARLPSEAALAFAPPRGLSTKLAEGPFRIDAMATGEHYLYLQVPPAGYVLDVRQGARDVADDNIVLAGNGAAPLTLVARPADYGAISGKVQGAGWQGRISQKYYSYPRGGRRSNPMRYYSARTSLDGAFKLENIVPGNYKLLAWELGRVLGLSPYMKAAVLIPFEKYGVSLEVHPNEHLSIDVSPIPR